MTTRHRNMVSTYYRDRESNRLMKSLYERAFSGIISIIDKQIDAYEEQKDAAIKGLEAQRDAALANIDAQKEALDAQIEALDKTIDRKNEEIQAIEDANKARENAINLQNKEYELHRRMNQRTSLVYKDGQMQYVADESAIRDAREEVDSAKDEIRIQKIEEEISVLEKRRDTLEDQQDQLDKQREQMEKYYDQLIAQTEAYWDSLIQGMEDYKSRWEELSELEEQAEIGVILEQLGVSMDDVLNMSGEKFNELKTNYLNVLMEMYRGNDKMIESMSKLADVDMSALPGYFAETEDYINRLAEGIDFTNVNDNLNGLIDSFSGVTDGVGSAVDAITGSVGGGESSKGGNVSGNKQGSGSGKGDSGGGNGLIPAIEEAANIAGEKLPEVKNKFDGEESIKSAADAATQSISGGEESDETSDVASNVKDAIRILSEFTTGKKGVPIQIEQWTNLSQVLSTILDTINQIVSGMETASTIKIDGVGEKTEPSPALSKGTDGALTHKEKNALVAEHGKPEIITRNDGSYEMVSSPTITDLNVGDSVIGEDDTEKLLNGKSSLSVGKAFSAGTYFSNSVPYSESNPAEYVKIMEASRKMAPLLRETSAEVLKMNDGIEKTVRMITNSQNITNQKTQHVENHWHITMPNVTDSTAAEKIYRDLQSLSTKKYQSF